MAETYLDDFISDVRMAETIEDEKFIMNTEQAQIRAALKNCKPESRPRIVSKLVFLELCGQQTNYGQMETILLMNDEDFSYKRIGYISAAVLIDESAELTVLVTQTLMKDLNSENPFIQTLALGFVANIGSAEICRSVAPYLKGLFESRYPRVLKGVGMATVQVVRKNPDLAELYKNSVQSLLNHPQHGVLISGINLAIEMMNAEPRLIKAWSQFVVPFTKIIKALVNSRTTPEYASGIYNDPIAQIQAMKALSMLGKGSAEIDEILQNVITSVEPRQNTGRALLYQAVEAIVKLSKKTSLRGLAFTQVSRLLTFKVPNTLYSALSIFVSVLSLGNASDITQIQKFKMLVVKLLDHRDPSIRRRALQVISLLIDETNVTTLVPEILGYIKMADSDFRAELVSKIYFASQKYAPSVEWLFEIVHQIFVESGNYVSTEILTNFCDLVESSHSIHAHAVESLSKSLLNFLDNQSLIQVSSYIIGEFATVDDGSFESLLHIARLPQTTTETKLYIMTAIAKLAARFNFQEKGITALENEERSIDLEIQQRAGELLRMLRNGGVCNAILGPVITEELQPQDEKVIIIENKDNDNEDLLSLLTETSTPTPQPQTLATELMELSSPPPQQIPILFETDDFVAYYQKGGTNNPKVTVIQLALASKLQKELSGFTMAFLPSTGWQIKVAQPSSTVLLPKGGDLLKQTLYLNDVGGTPLGLQIQFKYLFGAQPISFVQTVRNIP